MPIDKSQLKEGMYDNCRKLSDEPSDQTFILSGKLQKYHIDEPACVHVDDEEFARWMMQFNNKTVSVRYWISSRQLTVEEASVLDAEALLGKVSSSITHHGSEITGYLYTTEATKVGGHDLLEVFDLFAVREGYYLLLEVVVHSKEEV